MSDYVPTTWANGGAPGISAENLNKIESGIDTAHQEIDAGWVPGDIKQSACSTPSLGWLECNGAAVSRTTYAALFAAIGTTFGVGDGSTTFNIPEIRGEFVRGWDHGRGVDAGRVLGSAQTHDIQSHVHAGVGGQFIAASGIGSSDRYYGNGVNLTGAAGGTETRPRNVALMYCIKY